MVERLILAALIVTFGVAAWCAYNRLAVRKVATQAATDPLLNSVVRGIPTIVYFTTPFCEPCRTQQQPALARLAVELGGKLQVVKVDATEQPEAADRWGVFSAPTTFVLDADLTPRHVNRGVANADVLKRQLNVA